MRRNEIKRIVTQVQKLFEDESSELDENLDESLESEIFCEQSQETDAREHAKESHDSEYEMNNDNFVADSEEELDEWSSSDNNTTDYNENEQSESTSGNNDVFSISKQ